MKQQKRYAYTLVLGMLISTGGLYLHEEGILVDSTPMSLMVNSAEASTGETQTVDLLGPVSVGKPMPTFGGHTLAGQYLSFKNVLNQDQTVVVSYFATWCGPCRKGLPVIEKVVNADSNVTAVYIAFGEKSAGKVHHFAEELSLEGTIILDKFETIGVRHGIAGNGESTKLPRTFVLGADGTVKTIFTVEGDDFEEHLKTAIQQ